VDITRTVAILLVVFVHCSGFPYQFLNSQITTLDIANWFTCNIYAALGFLGVPLFIMLAGALMLTPEKADEPLRVFIKKRFNRIGWPLIFWTIAYFIWSYSVNNTPLTPLTITKGLLNGSYSILWFLYLIAGLYAVTPVFRVMVKNLKRNLYLYLLIIWFVGTTMTPFIHTFFKELAFDPFMFVLFDWIGYYLMGYYLMKTTIKRYKAFLITLFGLLIAILGDWWVTATYGEKLTGFFHNYMSFGIILGSAGMFLLLISIKPTALEGHPNINRVIRWFSHNTLPIYLIHVMVLEALRLGYFGFYLNETGYKIIDDLVWWATTLGISIAIVYPLRKIPIIKRLIG
jgi:surface polysaccharide O-acyltransferase-like enzyme